MITYLLCGGITFIISMAFIMYSICVEIGLFKDLINWNMVDISQFIQDVIKAMKDEAKSCGITLPLILAIYVLIFFILWPVGLYVDIKSYFEIRKLRK